MRKRMIGTSVVLSVILALAAGCGAQSTGTMQEETGTAVSTAGAGTSDAYIEDTGNAGAASDNVTNVSYTEAVTQNMINLKDSDYETNWQEENPVTITANGTDASADGAGVSAADGVICITTEGTYVLTGDYKGMVVIDTGDEDAKVRLVLDNASITSPDGPAILALTADKVTITLAEGSDNSITDSAAYSSSSMSTTYSDNDAADDDIDNNDAASEDVAGADYDAAIYSRTDLVLNAAGSEGSTGTLTITGNNKDAVHSTDDLRITGGTYIVTAADDGFVGKDRLEITDGTFDVTTYGDHGDAFKSTNTDEDGKGFIYVAGGDYTITAGDEAFQSAAGLLVTGGTFQISAQGKGFHADTTLQFDGGSVTIETSYEGLEAPVIVINDGTFDITAADDGINAAGGSLDGDSGTTRDSDDDTGTGDGPGNWARGGFESSSTGYLYINGGTIHINASGDGIDSNSSITQTGGTITVDGPTANMDGALDYDDTYEMSGGSVFAVGSSGMLQTISDSSKINCLAVVYSNTQAAGTVITIEDAGGNTVISFTPAKQYQSFVYASEALVQGETYTIYADDSKLCTVTLDGTITLVDDSGSATSAGQRGGFGFGRPGQRSAGAQRG